MKRVIKSTFLSLCLTVGAYSYAESVTPVINDDNTVTFRLCVPDADEVVLRGTFISSRKLIHTPVAPVTRQGKIRMRREGDSDCWTCTTGELPSDFYTYYFEVDGERMADPSNPDRVRDVADTLSWFAIGGGRGDDFMTRDVPHGSVRKVWYPSSLGGMRKRRMTVYTPAGYGEDKSLRYPVLYLLHGSGGDEDSWTDCGRAAQILDNLTAEGRCEPMIVVMPNGNADLAAAPGADPKHPDVTPSANNVSSMTGRIESVFMDDVVAFVDENFRTIPDKEHRAIAGLSLGGLHTMFISMNNPYSFDYVGLFSAQTTNALNDKHIGGLKQLGDAWRDLKNSLPFIGGGKVDKKISGLTSDELGIYSDVDNKLEAQFESDPELYYIAVGRDDFVKKLNDDLRARLDAKGYPYTYNETDGGHTWENWRAYLVDFLPRLFRSER